MNEMNEKNKTVGAAVAVALFIITITLAWNAGWKTGVNEASEAITTNSNCQSFYTAEMAEEAVNKILAQRAAEENKNEK